MQLPALFLTIADKGSNHRRDSERLPPIEVDHAVELDLENNKQVIFRCDGERNFDALTSTPYPDERGKNDQRGRCI